MGFAAEGAWVGLLARTQPELDLAKLEIEQAGGKALRLRADVRDPEELAYAVDRMRSSFGGLDILIAAAGVQGPIGPFLSSKPKAWNEQAELDLAKLEIEQAGGMALRRRADVRDPEELAHAVDRMRSSFGGLDILIAAETAPH